MAFKTLTLSALFTLATSVSAVTTPACYNHPGPLQRTGDYSFASLSFCNDICRTNGHPIAGAMGGNQCWCGFARPSRDSRIPVTSCGVKCNGFPGENCGGDGFWSVWPVAEASSSSASVSATPSA